MALHIAGEALWYPIHHRYLLPIPAASSLAERASHVGIMRPFVVRQYLPLSESNFSQHLMTLGGVDYDPVPKKLPLGDLIFCQRIFMISIGNLDYKQ